MPKTKTETIVSDKDGWRKVSVDVGQPDGTTKPAVYTYFSQWSTLKSAFDSAEDAPKSGATLYSMLFGKEPEGEESSQALLMRLVNTSIGRMASQMAYVAAQQASTWITNPITKQRENLMDKPLKVQVRAYNAYVDQILARLEDSGDTSAAAREQIEDSIRFGPWRAMGARLIEDGKVKANSEGKLEAVA